LVMARAATGAARDESRGPALSTAPRSKPFSTTLLPKARRPPIEYAHWRRQGLSSCPLPPPSAKDAHHEYQRNRHVRTFVNLAGPRKVAQDSSPAYVSQASRRRSQPSADPHKSARGNPGTTSPTNTHPNVSVKNRSQHTRKHRRDGTLIEARFGESRHDLSRGGEPLAPPPQSVCPLFEVAHTQRFVPTSAAWQSIVECSKCTKTITSSSPVD